MRRQLMSAWGIFFLISMSLVQVAMAQTPVQNLNLTSFCTPDMSVRWWRVSNPNSFDVATTWSVYGTPNSGSHIATPGNSFFTTPNVGGANTTKLFWFDENGTRKDRTKASNNQLCEYENLLLTSMCSDNPEAERRWRVRNPNFFPVTYTYQVVGTAQTGTLTAQPGDSFFFTTAVGGPNTTRINWLDENGSQQQQVKASGGAPCFVGDLNLTSLCSDDPATERNWRVTNPNPFSVNYTYQVVGSSQTGNLVATPGLSFFSTLTVGGANTTKISWKDAQNVTQQKTKASGGAACISLVAHYEFEDCAGGDFGIDSKGNFDAAVLNGPISKFGYTGSGLLFDGANDYLDVNQTVLDAADLQNGFTVAAWVNTRDNSTGKTIISFVDRNSNNNVDGDFMLRLNNNEQLVAWWYDANGRNILRHDPINFADYTWYHVAAIYDGSDLALYINGQEVERTAATLSSVNTNSMFVGASNFSGHPWLGKLDDVRVYNGAVSAGTIQGLANTAFAPQACCTVSTAQPVAYYRFDECGGTDFIDETGNFTAAISGAANWGLGYNAAAADLDADAFGAYSGTALTAAQLQDGFAASAWINVEDNNTGKTILALTDPANPESDGEFFFRVNNQEQLVAWWYNGGRQVIRHDDIRFVAGQWYHVAVVYTGSEMVLYINGQEKERAAATLSSASTSALYVAGGNYIPGNDHLFKGKLDEVKLFDATIAACEVFNMYLQQPNGAACNSASKTGETLNTAADVTDVIEKLQLDVYPVPANNVLNIKTSNLARVQLIDISGRIVWESEVADQVMQADISELTSGFYIVRATSATEVVTKNVVIQ